MSSTAKAGFDTIILADTLDLQQILTTARMPLSKGNIETPRFGRRDMESIASMRGGALNFEGFRMGNKEEYTNLVQKSIGPDNTKRIITYAPDGDLPGDQCFMIDSHQNSIEVGSPYNQAVMVTGVFAATGGPRYGNILKGCHQEDLYFEPGSYEITVRNLNGATPFGLGSTGSNRRSPLLYTLDALANNGAIQAALKAGYESMPAYAGHVFTVVSNLVKTGPLWTGTINITMTGGESAAPKILNDRAGTVSLGVGQTNLVYVNAGGSALGIDELEPTVSGYTAHLHCVGAKDTAGASVTAKVQHSDDGAAWTDMITFAAFGGKTKERVVSADDYFEVKRHTRALWTIAGAGTAQFAFLIALSRYGKHFS